MNKTEALEVIRDANVMYREENGFVKESIEGTGVHLDSKWSEDPVKLIDAIQCLQKDIPDDLKERKKAAADIIYQNPEEQDLNDKKKLLKSFEEWKYKYGMSSKKFRSFLCLLNPFETDYFANSDCYDNAEYPEQWLEILPEEEAGWLYKMIKENGFDFCEEWNLPEVEDNTYVAPDKILDDNFIVSATSEGHSYKVSKMPFKYNILELPDFLDEEDL